jgi:hypothetical protein
MMGLKFCWELFEWTRTNVINSMAMIFEVHGVTATFITIIMKDAIKLARIQLQATWVPIFWTDHERYAATGLAPLCKNF